MVSSHNVASIDLDALAHNFDIIRQKVPSNTQIMPMVKANAYGHGVLGVVSRLKDADQFGVATLAEALQLRDAGITKPITVMRGFCNSDEVQAFSQHNLTAVIHHAQQLEWLNQQSLPQPLNAWLKIDTGMHRLGFLPEQFLQAYMSLKTSPNIKQPFGLMTHLATADSDAVFVAQQLSAFEKLTKGLNNPTGIGNSAAILAHHKAHFDLVRPGIMLYGVSPFADRPASAFGLKPVMTLSSHIISTKQVSAGEPVGYGCTWTASQDTPIAIIGIGYGDGYPRHARHGTPVLVNNVVCPLVGRVSMDMIAVDISAVPDARVNDRVVLWGEGLPIEQIASVAGTIAYELFCSVTDRVERKRAAIIQT